MKRCLLYIPLLLCALAACRENFTPDFRPDELPALFPDYAGVTVPPGIAPLNFRLEAACSRMDVRIEGSRAGSIRIQGRNTTDIPARKWKRLLAGNTGGELSVTV